MSGVSDKFPAHSPLSIPINVETDTDELEVLVELNGEEHRRLSESVAEATENMVTPAYLDERSVEFGTGCVTVMGEWK